MIDLINSERFLRNKIFCGEIKGCLCACKNVPWLLQYYQQWTYEAEIWVLTSYQRNEIAVTQRTTERTMLSVRKRNKIRKEDIKTKTEVNDIRTKTVEVKVLWADNQS